MAKEVEKNTQKPAYKSTEFWLVVVSNIMTVVSAMKGIIPAETAVIVSAVLNGVYTVLRSLVKQPDITTVVKVAEDGKK